jgi:RNA polymerase sigma factor (sigma-70 family)
MIGCPFIEHGRKAPNMGFSYQQLRTTELVDLVEEAQAGEHDDSPAMNEIIRRFERKARQIVAALCARPADREDVAIEALVALVRAVRRHDVCRAGFVAYAITFMTGAARRESMRLAALPEACVAGSDLTAAFNSAPDMRPVADLTPVQPGWGTGRVAKVIASLPRQRQALLAERYVHDLDLATIAQLHGSSVSAVSQRIKTAHRHVLAAMPPAALHVAAA